MYINIYIDWNYKNNNLPKPIHYNFFSSTKGREKFSIKKFSADNNLGTPIGINFFVADFDYNVPTIYKEYGII